MSGNFAPVRRKAGGAFLWAVIIVVVAAGHVRQAVLAPTYAFDEPLWFMRSQVYPADFSTRRQRYWAIDIPSANRWVWYAVLKVTGLDVVPEGEEQVWRLDEEGRLYFATWRLSDSIEWKGTIEEWKAEHGYYAPRKAVIAMRMANLAVYALMIVCLWITARVALRSAMLALLAIVPVMVTPLFAVRMAFESSSGDVYCLAAMSGALALWTWGHARGNAAQWPMAVAIGVLSGVATSSKHVGIFVLFAYAVYVLIYASWLQKIILPVVSSAVAFVVFAVIDPVIIVDPAGPVRVCIEMIQRRFYLIQGIVVGRGPLTWTEYFEKALFWWPLLPVLVFVAWRCRKEPWFAPVALWGGVSVAGTLAGIAHTKLLTPHYLAPLELGLYFPAAVMMIGSTRIAPEKPVAESEAPVQVAA